MRHFAMSACDAVHLSDCSTARMLGHTLGSGRASKRGYAMRDHYGNLPVEEVLAEQADKLPDGCLGTLGMSEVKVMDDIPKELKVVWRDYKEGRLKVSEVIDRLDELKTRTLKADLSIGT